MSCKKCCCYFFLIIFILSVFGGIGYGLLFWQWKLEDKRDICRKKIFDCRKLYTKIENTLKYFICTHCPECNLQCPNAQCFYGNCIQTNCTELCEQAYPEWLNEREQFKIKNCEKIRKKDTNDCKSSDVLAIIFLWILWVILLICSLILLGNTPIEFERKEQLTNSVETEGYI